MIKIISENRKKERKSRKCEKVAKCVMPHGVRRTSIRYTQLLAITDFSNFFPYLCGFLCLFIQANTHSLRYRECMYH